MDVWFVFRPILFFLLVILLLSVDASFIWNPIKRIAQRSWGRLHNTNLLDRPAMRGFFHWQYSGVAISFLLPTGIGLVLADKFAFAYFFFLLFGVWSICFWLTSDTLSNVRKALKSRRLRRDEEGLRRTQQGYFRRKWAVVIFLVLLSVALEGWTRKTQVDLLEATALAERKEVYDHLAFKPFDLAAKQRITDIAVQITNGGGANIDKHLVTCRVVSMWDASFMGIGDSIFRHEFPEGLLEGGDTETVDCFSTFNFVAPALCADVIVIVDFNLVSQPKVQMEKAFRFDGRRSDGSEILAWHGKPIFAKSDGCADLTKEAFQGN